MYNALTDDGIVVMQLGVTPDLEDTADQYSKSKNRAKLTNGLSKIGFESLHAYEEVNACFIFVSLKFTMQLVKNKPFISSLLTYNYSRIAVSVIRGHSSSPAKHLAAENGGIPIRQQLT